MQSIKENIVLDNNITLTAGAGNHTSNLLTITTHFGGSILIKITNGGTGPTVAAQAQVQVSGDNSNFYNYGGALVATTGNNDVNYYVVAIPNDTLYAQVVSGSNTGQNVTIRVEYMGVQTLI